MIEILMTIKDRQDYLTRQLDFLSPMLNVKLRLTVFDDGSEVPLVIDTDNPFIRIFRSEMNLGLIEARNQLLIKSFQDADYVLYLDDDIFIHNLQLFIDFSINELQKNEFVAAVSCPYINLPTVKHGSISTFKKVKELSAPDSVFAVYFFGGTSIFKRRLLLNFGGFEGAYRIYLEEEDLALRLYSAGFHFQIAYGQNFIAIHDQAPGKNFNERNQFLLSNRLLFHYKFIDNTLVRFLLNFIYLIVYAIKIDKFSNYKKAISRYKDMKRHVAKNSVGFSVFGRFFMKRYF
ncbi:glycosyltransferase [Rheinheimera texasensis]|uniref:glycosyltransferase family 2 protein n=1 Tax=Rheinheimera texasensis TaxID=306205 RepID=UPI0032B192FC